MRNMLRQYIERKIQISDEGFDDFFSYFKMIELKKREYLLEEGKICRNYYFVSSGLLRTFFIDYKGKDVITSFAVENWWVTDIESFILQKPSQAAIQALESSVLLAISHDDLERAYAQNPMIDRLFRLITQNIVIALQNRHNFYLKKSSAERYQGIVKTLPKFVQRIPQHMLASYLEMSPEYLSELRKK
nr:Crp/Fnr family transcriptional regulator [uncultured Allomuricauda sp.]